MCFPPPALAHAANALPRTPRGGSPAQQAGEGAALWDAPGLKVPAPAQAHEVGGEVLAQQLQRLGSPHALVHHLAGEGGEM